MRKQWIVTLLMTTAALTASASTDERDTLDQSIARHPIAVDGGIISQLGHRIEVDVVPSTILHTNRYLKGENLEGREMNHAFSGRLKYAFQLPAESHSGRIYKGAYQGIGVAWHDFNPQLGNPFSAFIFQGARIKSWAPRLSLNYEWNLGLTFGWHPYDAETNPENRVIGSRVTAYIDADIYLRWQLSRSWDLNAGVSVIHFSNGNTTIPNAGLNVLGGRVSLAYYIHRQEQPSTGRVRIPSFRRRINYDLLLFVAYRRQGFDFGDGPVAMPGKYEVFGFNFTPLYSVNYWFSTGLSVDGVYDRSANLLFEDYIVGMGDKGDDSRNHVGFPPARKQMALGLSARAEFTMPFFSINVGVGRNLICAPGDLRAWYQLLALKVNMSRKLFLHIGYSLQDFRYPNHLMLGLGWHFK